MLEEFYDNKTGNLDGTGQNWNKMKCKALRPIKEIESINQKLPFKANSWLRWFHQCILLNPILQKFLEDRENFSLRHEENKNL